MKGLKLEPGWRQACVTWLNLFLPKSKPPTRARMAPVRGSSATKRAFDLGQLGQPPVALGAFCIRRTTAPRRICTFGPAFDDRPEVTGFRPAPVTVTTSPDCSMATTLRGEASVHHGGAQFVVVRVLGQGLGDAGVDGRRVGRQVDEGLRAAVDLAQLVVHQTRRRAGRPAALVGVASRR
jgi:hypothetical protein